MAQREGFEPPDSCPSTVFKTAAFDRSAISPYIFLFFSTAICCIQVLALCYAEAFTHTSDAIKIDITSLRSLQDPPLRPFCTSAYIYFFRRQLLYCSKSLLYAVRKPSLHPSDAIKNRYYVAALLTRPAAFVRYALLLTA